MKEIQNELPLPCSCLNPLNTSLRSVFMKEVIYVVALATLRIRSVVWMTQEQFEKIVKSDCLNPLNQVCCLNYMSKLIESLKGIES